MPGIKKGVLVIEDMYEDYKFVFRVFKDYGWEIYPGEDDYRKKWNKMYLDGSPNEIIIHIEKYLKKMYREIGVIILDILLIRHDNKDQTGIDKVLPMIRNLDADDKEFKVWGANVPIIAFTRIPPREIARTALTGQDYVDAFFRKDRLGDEANLLVFTAHSLLSTFRLRMQEGLDGAIADQIDALLEYLERDKKAICSKINDVEIILKGAMDSTESQLRLILNALFVQMNDDAKANIMQEFSMELKSALGDEQFKKIEQSLQKTSLKEGLKNCIKKGTKADFVDFLLRVWEELSESGALTGIPFVKFVGYGLSTVLKIMSKG